MKTKFTAILIILFLFSFSVFSQNLSLGLENGVNYSNIRKTFDYERFASEPGTVNGIFAKYQLGNWFTLQSGINHATIYFNQKEYYYSDYWKYSSSFYDPSLMSSSLIAPTSSYLISNNYSFLRIPLLIKYRTPGRVNFEIGGGVYYAFLTNDEFRGKDHDQFDKEYRDENFPEMNDWGWILVSTVNYNINNKWSIFASGQITYGKEEYFEREEGKMGSTELTFGVEYKLFAPKSEFIADSLGKRISILPHSGFNISRANSKNNKNQYRYSTGFSSGISLKFDLRQNFSLLSGVWFERKGYTMGYKGYYSAIYHVMPNNEPSTIVNSDVQLDYLTFPLMMDVSMGSKIQSHINFGIYYSLLQNAFAEGEETSTYESVHGYQSQKNYFNESKDLLFKNSDLGFLLGYRIEIPVFNWAKTFVSAYQSFGITNILDYSDEAKEKNSFIINENLKNQSTSIIFGLSIPVNQNP